MNKCICIALLLVAHQLCGQTPKLTVETYELANGLKVYLNEDKNASNVYGAVWVNAGGKDDPADATGIAHYLEHMLFKGTDKLGTQNYELERIHLDSIKMLYDKLALEEDKNIKADIQKQINVQELKASNYAIPNEFDKLLKSLGSTGVNASTNDDYTNYYNFFPGNQLAKWLDIYAHRFQNPQFRLFQSELEAVYEEKNRAGDDLERRVVEKFTEYIYGDNPYSTQTVLGSVEHLKNPSLTKMYEYFQKYYVPNNMALVLCGNFDSDTAKPLIESSFGKLKRGKETDFKAYKAHQFDGRELKKVRITPIKAGFMGYKLVPEGHPDQPALQIISQMMSNGNKTGFIDKLQLNNDALYAGAYSEFLEEDGSTFIFYVPKIFGKSLKRFEEDIRGSFNNIAEGNFTDEYFNAIKNGVYRNFNLSLERLASRGRYLGLSFIYDIDYHQFLTYPDRIQNLKKTEVQRVAAQYYGENYFTMRSRTGFPKKPKLKKPPYKPITSRTEESSVYAKKFEEIEVTQSTPQFIDLDTDLHVTDGYIYHTSNPLNDIFTLRLVVAKGSISDRYYPLVIAALNNSGTSKYTVSELKNEFANLGATYSFNAGYTTFEISVTGLDSKLKETLSLIKHVLQDFKPTEQTIDYLFNQRKTSNKISKNNPSEGGVALYVYGLFGEKSSFKNRLSAKEIKSLNPEVLKTKLEELISNGFTSIHYVGTKQVEAINKTFEADAVFKKNTTDDFNFIEAQTISESTIYIVNDKKAIQSYVYYVVNGEPLDYESTYKKEAFNAYYTNSLSGLLFQEVREFRSLAYSTGGSYFDPIYEPNKRGRLVLFTGSQADKTTSAVEVVYGLLTDMPIYESRMEGIKSGLILASATNKPTFRAISEIAEDFLETGFSQDPNQMNYQKYSELSFDDIQSFYESNVKDKPVMITIYGDASKFDKAKLSKFGKIVELEMDDIITE